MTVAPGITLHADVVLEDLRDLMRSVTESSHDLQETHAALQQQVVGLQHELADANEQLQRSRALAAVGQMAAGIAHEVRNPLASVRLYAQMLAEDLSGKPEQKGLCDKIDRAVAGLDTLVRDVLRFARDTTITPVEIGATDVVEHALAACPGATGAIDAVIEVRAPARLRLDADPELLASALANVIRNALEAVAETETPKVRVTIERGVLDDRSGRGSRAAIVFEIQDNGAGMTPDVLERMFDPFFTARRDGTGLGLAIVHRIIDAHGGRIVAWSRPGAGTRVRICVPRHASGAPGDAPLVPYVETRRWESEK